MDLPSSRKTTSTVVAEAVYQFVKGGFYGAIWGCVTPFQSSPNAQRSMASSNTTSKLSLAPPFSSWSLIYSNAIMFGCVMGAQRLSSQMLALARRQDDFLNDVFGFFVSYQYYKQFLEKESRIRIHNRVVVAGVTCCVAYATVLA